MFITPFRRLPPVDVAYHVLDGLHQLTGYDHSAALFVLDPTGRSLTLLAERIAWTRRGKSARIGAVLPLPETVRGALGEGAVYGFNRVEGPWQEWTDGWCGASGPATPCSIRRWCSRPRRGWTTSRTGASPWCGRWNG